MAKLRNGQKPPIPAVPDRSSLLKRIGLIQEKAGDAPAIAEALPTAAETQALPAAALIDVATRLEKLDAAISQLHALQQQNEETSQLLETRQQSLDSREVDLQLRAEFAAKRQEELAEKERQLLADEKAMAMREADARSGFLAQNREACTNLRDEIARLERERDAIIRCCDDEQRAAHASIAAEKKSFLDEQGEERKKLAAEQAEVLAAARRLATERNVFELRERNQQEFESTLRRELEEENRRERVELSRRIDRMQRQAGDDAGTIQRQRQQLEGYEELDRLLQQHGFTSPADLLKRYAECARENYRLREDNADRPAGELEAENERLQDRVDELGQSLAERDRELGVLRTEVERSRTGVLERQTLAQEKRVLENHKRALESAVTDLERRLDALTERQQGSETFPALSGMDRDFVRAPALADIPDLGTFADELRQRIATVTGTRLYYPEQTIRLFLGGLAMSRLHILQGISGTGKTSLAVAFAAAVGGHCTVVPVQAGWRDRDDLLGHFNAFERRYYERECLQAIYRAGTEAFRDRFNVVLLDEMNLSHPEQYFAEFLSALERRPDEREIVLTETACTNPPRRLRDGRKLPLPDNLWFIGTANEDETTYGFADKTIDRAHIMELPRSETAFDARTPAGAAVYSVDSLKKAFAAARRTHGQAVSAALTAIRDSEFSECLEQDFGLGWGNRLERQALDFVPVVAEAGGSLGEAFDHLLASRLFRPGKITDRFDVDIESILKLKTALKTIWKQVDAKHDVPLACLERLEREIRRMEPQR